MLETAAQVAELGVVLWVFTYQLPKARREQDTFAVICSLLTAVRLEFVVRQRPEAGRGSCSRRPTAHRLVPQGPPCVYR
jgi:hypothetical protein